MGGAEGTGPSPVKTPQPAAAGKEVQVPLTVAEQNTDSYLTGKERRDFYFSQTPVGTREGCLLFCYNQPLPDLAGTVLLWLYYCYCLSRLLKTYLEAWLDNVVGYRVRLKGIFVLTFCIAWLWGQFS